MRCGGVLLIVTLLILLAAGVGIMGAQPEMPGITACIPSLNPNETVVAVAAPQQFGAKGDGVADDTTAFQKAIDFAYNAGHSGGGVVYVPAGHYAFYGNLSIPEGVTIHGDWKDWTSDTTGAIGTIFDVHIGANQNADPITGTPFISMPHGDCALIGVTIWYPDQSPATTTPVPYPYTIKIGSNTTHPDGTIGTFGTDGTVQNVILVNSYEGIYAASARHTLSSVIGTPLAVGLLSDGSADVSVTQDVRFLPDVWAASKLKDTQGHMPNLTDPYVDWIAKHGIGLLFKRTDGENNIAPYVSGYSIGIDLVPSTLWHDPKTGVGHKAPGVSLYEGTVKNCAIAVVADIEPGQSGAQFSRMHLEGQVAVDRLTTDPDIAKIGESLSFHTCTLIGTSGTAAHLVGGDWHSWMQFHNCTIIGQLKQDSGVINAVNTTITTTGDTPPCTMAAAAVCAGFIGCTFHSSKPIVNNGAPENLQLDADPTHAPTAGHLPDIRWSDIRADYQKRQPTRSTLFLVTDYGAVGDGVMDDTSAINKALQAAAKNGGGIVYLPGGHYKTTDSLIIPVGVELRGVFETRHIGGLWYDNGTGQDPRIKPGHVKASAIEPHSTSTPAIVLEGAKDAQSGGGIRGIDINYEDQISSVTPIVYPAAIQGRGANIYTIAVTSPNPYIFVDFDSYACTNHLLYMINGWALNTEFNIGHGSTGSVICTQSNPGYWALLQDSKSQWNPTKVAFPECRNYASHNLTMFQMGHCTETMLDNFIIPSRILLRAVSEDGQGPDIQGEAVCCDNTVQAFSLEATAKCRIDIADSTFAVENGTFPDLDSSTVVVASTPTFQGTFRLYNIAPFARHMLDFSIAGGDVGAELVHNFTYSAAGAQITGGTFHLTNQAAFINNVPGKVAPSGFPPFQVIFNRTMAVPGVSEVIGNLSRTGYIIKPDDKGPLKQYLNYSTQ